MAAPWQRQQRQAGATQPSPTRAPCSRCSRQRVCAAVPAARLAFLAAVLARVGELKDFTTICSSAPSELLALMGVRAWPALLERQMATVRRWGGSGGCGNSRKTLRSGGTWRRGMVKD